MKWVSLFMLSFLVSCASAPPPPPEHPPPSGPASTPPADPAAPAPATPAEPDPSRPPPEVKAGCLPECAMVHGKCQALAHPGSTFDGEEEPTDEVGPGPKRREKMVTPCDPSCCQGQD
jgi:hypothetical protein